MSSFIKKMKSMASFSNLKVEIPITPEITISPPSPIPSESPRDRLLVVIDDMLEEVDHMPNQYKNQTTPPSFLTHFLDYVDDYNQNTLDHAFLQNLAKNLFTSF